MAVIFLHNGGKQITLNLTIQSDPQVVLAQFRPFLAPLYEAFEAATLLASDLIEHHDWIPTPQLFSHIVRADVRKTLNGKACPVEYDDKIRIVQMDPVSMEGLATAVDGVGFKILKGELLPPPLSDARQYFYQHQNPNLWMDDKVPELRSLIVLWECDAQGKALRMYLVCPKDASGDCEWQIRIPPPAEWMAVPKSVPSPNEPDLDISKDEPGEQQK